jgi:hypothetical protein
MTRAMYFRRYTRVEKDAAASKVFTEMQASALHKMQWVFCSPTGPPCRHATGAAAAVQHLVDTPSKDIDVRCGGMRVCT